MVLEYDRHQKMWNFQVYTEGILFPHSKLKDSKNNLRQSSR